MTRLSSFALSSVLVLMPVAVFGQNADNREPTLTEKQKQKLAADALVAEQRSFAISQLISLADEARSYNDLQLRCGATFESTTDKDFGINNVLGSLANNDLHRSMDVARSFKRERPRALAVLAVAGATLEHQAARNQTP